MKIIRPKSPRLRLDSHSYSELHRQLLVTGPIFCTKWNVVEATFVYNIAMRDQMLPRKAPPRIPSWKRS